MSKLLISLIKLQRKNIHARVLTYWSSTTDAGGTNYVWGVSFIYGNVIYINKDSPWYVRCVRGGSESGIWGFDYLTSGNSVQNRSTGLTWQKVEGGSMTWESALSYCEGLTLDGLSDWRLPSVKELQSLVDYSRYNPSINTTYFPKASSLYWSSSTEVQDTILAWSVSFFDGQVDVYYKLHSKNSVRCVRGG
ncbi:DUF1566 domain-containing protein [Deltaproteobacteria bacterium TL4]